MKKLLVILMSCLALGLYAEVGFGVVGTYGLSQYVEGATDAVYNPDSPEGFYQEDSYYVGAMAYVDVGTAKLSVGYKTLSSQDWANQNWTISDYTYMGGHYLFPGTWTLGDTAKGTGTADANNKKSYIPVQLMGKLPLDFGVLVITPMLGIEYDYLLESKAFGDDVLGGVSSADRFSLDYSDLIVKLGADVDFMLGDNLYIRGGLLVGYRIPSQAQAESVAVDALWWTVQEFTNFNVATYTADLSVGIGIKFGDAKSEKN